MKSPNQILAGAALATLITSIIAGNAPASPLSDTKEDQSSFGLLMAQVEQPSDEAQPPKKHKKRKVQDEGKATRPDGKSSKPDRKKKREAAERKSNDAEAAPAKARKAADDRPAKSERKPERKKKRESATQASDPKVRKAIDKQPQKAERKKGREAQRAGGSVSGKGTVDAVAPVPKKSPTPKLEQSTQGKKRLEKKGKTPPAGKSDAEGKRPAETAPVKTRPQNDPAQAKQPVDAKPAKRRPGKDGKNLADNSATQQSSSAANKKAGRERVRAEEAPNDGKPAAVLDSQKKRQGKDGRRPGRDKQRLTNDGDDADARRRTAGPPPVDDRAAQQAALPKQINPVTEESGRRRDRSSDDDGEPRRRHRPQGSEMVRELGDRVIIQYNDQLMVESNDRPRMSRNARDVYYEDLPRGRTRETITRRNGTQVITVRNSYGDVIRRSRIAPDGREYVLAYVDDDNYGRVDDWRDPGDELPPMQLDVPVDEYILDATVAQGADAYYDFLQLPPVEPVERLYSVDEVKRSARIRDKTRRIDIDTLTFEFGSAEIAEDQVIRLELTAKAIEKVLARNPAETFLIEGHTDAVGSDVANLALSDRRAEAVADALTNVFEIPPENLATQGYGEEYLKVRTQEPEHQNRRVSIRRITPLIAPVADVSPAWDK